VLIKLVSFNQVDILTSYFSNNWVAQTVLPQLSNDTI